MATKTRIYLAEIADKTYLVDTSSVGQARTAVAKKHVSVRLAKPAEIVQLMKAGKAEYIVVGADENQTDIEDPRVGSEPPLTFGTAT